MFKDNAWGEFVGIMTAENMDDEIEIKLNDDEKLKLIEFYMEDETLWNNDNTCQTTKIELGITLMMEKIETMPPKKCKQWCFFRIHGRMTDVTGSASFPPP